MQQCKDLADYQEALLELLFKSESAEEILFHLRHEAVFAPFADYIETFEPRMLEVAMQLVKKWGEKGTNDQGT